MIIFSFLLAFTFHTVEIDGDLSHFDTDELVYKDASSDSYWQGNELYGLFVTWDAGALYLGLSYRVQNNAALIVLDADRGKGVNDINNLDWYPRNFQFYGMNADVLCALWNADLSTGGVREILAKDRTQPLRDVEIINNGVSGDSSALMVKIPFSVLYGNSGIVKPYDTIKLVALITGSDHAMGADAIPDNENIGSSSAIRTHIEIVLDKDGDSIPDDSVSVINRTKVVTYPEKPLYLEDFEISNKIVDENTPLSIRFSVTDYSFAKVYIYSEQGKKVYEWHFESLEPDVEKTVSWTPSESLPQGIYYVLIDINDIIRSKKAFFIKR